MIYLLFPGRHLLTTRFQHDYLYDILRLPINKLDLLGEFKGDKNQKIEEVIFTVTSANQENSRYNPVPFYTRSMGLDRFSKEYRETLGISFRIIGIPHFNPNENFVNYILKEVDERTENQIKLTPENTVVLCSTPALINMYMKKGFAVLPAEYDKNTNQFKTKGPIDYIKLLSESKNDWKNNSEITEGISKAQFQFWTDFPEITDKICRLWRDPLLTESGSLTESRNYSTYALGMGHQALLLSKYNEIKDSVITGKIVDEGCADGALMTLLARDFSDSDIIGIEITSEFTARCLERQRAGEFGGTFVHFHQRNLMEKIFEDSSIDTTICNSTTHEIWSYGDGEKSLTSYLKMKHDQLRKNGRLIIRDVVGPSEKDIEIYMKLRDDDGSNDDFNKHFENREELADFLNSLSTKSKFLRFAEDYLKEMREKGHNPDSKIKFRIENVDGQKYFVLRLKDAMEFMTKKDYTDNWKSELNEEFGFWSFEEWKEKLKQAGFRVLENPNESQKSSRAFAIPWIVENRFKNKVWLYKKVGANLVELEYPVTNIVLIGEKE